MAKLTVLSNPRPGREQEFNQWYDEVHVPDLLKVPGIAGVERFRLHALPGAPTAAHGYLAVYELDGDPEAVLAAMAAHSAESGIATSDALDTETIRMDCWDTVGPQ